MMLFRQTIVYFIFVSAKRISIKIQNCFVFLSLPNWPKPSSTSSKAWATVSTHTGHNGAYSPSTYLGSMLFSTFSISSITQLVLVSVCLCLFVFMCLFGSEHLACLSISHGESTCKFRELRISVYIYIYIQYMHMIYYVLLLIRLYIFI